MTAGRLRSALIDVHDEFTRLFARAARDPAALAQVMRIQTEHYLTIELLRTDAKLRPPEDDVPGADATIAHLHGVLDAARAMLAAWPS